MDKLNRIKAVLAEKGITNKDLAEGLNIDVTTVSRWCRNTSHPTVKSLFDIATFLDISVHDLLINNKK